MDNVEIMLQESVNEMFMHAKAGGGSRLMNTGISDHEIRSTFGKGSNTPGPDGISSKLVDEADRNSMHMCLRMLWNNAWSAGYFITEWKQENRVVIPKIGKDDYNECNSYRTVSITSCLGKRFEHITSQRLLSTLESLNFDDSVCIYEGKKCYSSPSHTC